MQTQLGPKLPEMHFAIPMFAMANSLAILAKVINHGMHPLQAFPHEGVK